MLKCKEAVMFECNKKYKQQRNKKRRRIAGIWQC